MFGKKIFSLFLSAIVLMTVLQFPQQSVIAVSEGIKELKGTDICNGIRGQNFDEGWKFNKGEVSNGQSTSYSDSGWSNVTLPHDWSIYNSFNQSSPAGGGGGYLDGGIGWYRKTFTVPSDYAGKKVFIEFDGAYMNSQVWINGTSLGTRPYGYSSFEYDLTPYLNIGGSNVIAVRLNNNQPTSRWYSGSGIYRNVWLTVLDPIHVAYCGMFVTTPTVSSSSATANVSTKVLNQGSTSKSVSLATTITDAEGNEVASNTSAAVNMAGSGSNTFSQNLTVTNPHLWSPASPYLYTVKTQVVVDGNVVDTYSSTLGFRYFSFSSTTGFSLNGVNMKLNGVCLHHDLGALGAAVNYRAIERELQIMKDMGCNAIRTSHNPPDPQLLEICDRLGLMVMDEAFDCWETGKTTNDYHLYFNSWAQTDLQAMVTRDRNHPAIIMYSVGNEIPSPTVATATKLKNWVKDIDNTRPVAWGCFAADMGDATHQAVASALDLAGYNYFPYTYDGGHSGHPEWKMFGSETSSAVRSRGVYKTPTNKNILTDSDNQCSSYDNSVVSWGNSAESSYNEINKRNYMAGEFVWTGFDYIGEPTPYGWPAKSSYFGIVDTCGFPKDIYYFYQSKWGTKPMVHILPHWNWSAGTNVEVWAYSNCDKVELFLNGSSLGSKSVGTAGHLTWNVPWASGTLRAKGTKGDTVVYDEVVTAGAASKVLLKPDRTSVKADGKDLIYIETDIADSNNVTVPTADNAVNFSISGPGVIVGVDNGNPISTESYKGNSRKAFSGKCLVIVQPTKVNGTITVTASSNGLSAGSVSITSAGGAEAPVVSAYKKIEAENYDNQSGIQNESCTEGGQDVGFIENGDYTVYNNVDFGSGAESFQARVSSGTSGGNIEIRLDSITGPVIGTCPVAGTGDWQTFTDAKCSVSEVSGKHDVYLKFTGESGYLLNLNWFNFIQKNVTQVIPGDLNGDAGVDATDYALMKKYLLGSITDFPVENDLEAGDLNKDGVIDALDFAVFKKFLLGIITKLPYSS
ncbi:MAG TPA: carbohydrate-binding protein [Ruminiclostridium sp.]|nr:carbohydrate-binding protein [Ruminiclostridium sp.]